MKRLLVVKISDIGDLITATPALAALRARYPDARIDVLTTRHAAPALDHTGLADETITYNVGGYERLKDLLRPAALRESFRLARRLRAGRYDAVLLFHQLSTRFGALKQAAIVLATGARRRCGLDNGRGWFLTDRVPDQGFGTRHQADYWLAVSALVGAAVDSPEARRLHLGTSQADQAWARTALPDGPYYVALHPGSGGLNLARRWDAEKFAAWADAQLAARADAVIVLIGGPNDDAEAVLSRMHQPSRVINLAGQTTLHQLAAALARCSAYLGADSGVMHMAAGVSGIRQLTALFGPTNHAAWGPYRPDDSASVTVIRSGVLCSPCAYIGQSVGLRTGCAARTCMKLIPADLRVPYPPSQRRRQAPDVHILGVPIHALTFDSLLARLDSELSGYTPERQERPLMIVTANPELVMIAQRDTLFYTILNRCDIVTADGIGLLWAARRLGKPLPERVTGSDGLPRIAERAAQRGWPIFLLGAASGVAEEAAGALKARFPGLRIVGTYAGSPSVEEEDPIVALVNASGAAILFLAYGSPAQEKWIARNLPRLRVGVVVGVGGAFDFVAGRTQRAPIGMQRLGLEWLHRLIREPWRWRRMLRLPRFVLAVLRRGERGPGI